jgi:hypothetical protein
MPDLVALIPNHGYADDTEIFVSWLNGNFFVDDKTTDSFKLAESIGGSLVQYTVDITEGFVRKIDKNELTSIITGLEHLEGESVKVTSGGRIVATETVVNGQITIPTTEVTNYSVGKTYTSTVIPMDLDIEGTGLSTTKRINRTMVKVLDTIGGEVGPDLNHMEVISSSDEPFSGFKEVSIPGGYSRDTDIIVRQTEPLPMTLLSITYDIGVNND